jgi:hypothetical protein
MQIWPELNKPAGLGRLKGITPQEAIPEHQHLQLLVQPSQGLLLRRAQALDLIPLEIEHQAARTFVEVGFKQRRQALFNQPLSKQGDGINDPQAFAFLDANQVVASPTHHAQRGLLVKQGESQGGTHRLCAAGEVAAQLKLVEACRQRLYKGAQPQQAVVEIIGIGQLDQLQIRSEALQVQLRHQVGAQLFVVLDEVTTGRSSADHLLQARRRTGRRTAGKDHLIGLMQLNRLEDRIRTTPDTDDQDAGHANRTGLKFAP